MGIANTSFARLFPPQEPAFLREELTRMGHPAPDTLRAAPEAWLTGKVLAVPAATAQAFRAWWAQHGPEAWCYHVPGATAETCDVLLSGPMRLVSHLRTARDPALRPLLTALDAALDRQAHRPQSLTLGDHTYALHQRPLLMGILNVTPDSFSDGGLYCEPDQALTHAESMLAAGADVIDVGGQSSRPGAAPVPGEVELMRVVPVIHALVQRYHAVVSIDTYRARVAAAALDAGAVLVNDISAMTFDAQMAPLIARRGASVVLMHMQGTPQTMQRAPTYRHVLDDVARYLAARLDVAQQHGIPRQRILLDPGFGFGKTVQHNLALLHGLEHLGTLGQPLLVGTSRKSFLGHLLQRQVWDRLEGTLTTVFYAVQHGAAIVRVHDVAPVAQTLRLLTALARGTP